MIRSLFLAAAVALLAAPARAQVDTVAWMAASSWCSARQAGLSSKEASRVSVQGTSRIYPAEVQDRAFVQLMISQMDQMCPQFIGVP